ncbi:MAG TPA: AEC family transporter [Bacillota bacterium]|nr:AEC family transporter [Bacillota bacterium]HPF42612.1 AEC family transporter [Bacillota bacterium]HPJ86237.1 AEC family transporter [Bacillota bacterium]HPQ62273.1 AEC family transporter [Bacillota bacterium]
MDTLLFALNAVLPLLLMIGLGYILSRTRFLGEEFWPCANRFVFRIALPCLLFYTVYSASGLQDIRWNVVLYASAGVLVLFVIGFLVAMFFVKDPTQKGVINQGVFRSNMTIIGVPLAEALGGADAVLVVALVSLVIIPLYNALSVIALSVFLRGEDGEKVPWIKVLLKILSNPLIIAIVLGILSLYIRSLIPVFASTGEPVFSLKNDLTFLYTCIKWLGQIASPLALVVLGGGFQFAQVRAMKREITLGVLLRTIMAPGLMLTLAVILAKYTTFFAFESTDYPALIATFGSPVAVVSAIMASEMKNDGKLAGQIVVWSSLFSIPAIFLIVVIYRTLGLL